MRCDQCKHWNPEPDEHGYRAVADIGQCMKAVQLWDATEWNSADTGDLKDCERVTKPEFVEQMSFVQDGSDYKAGLWTKPDFYCAHFEPNQFIHEQD